MKCSYCDNFDCPTKSGNHVGWAILTDSDWNLISKGLDKNLIAEVIPDEATAQLELESFLGDVFNDEYHDEDMLSAKIYPLFSKKLTKDNVNKAEEIYSHYNYFFPKRIIAIKW